MKSHVVANLTIVVNIDARINERTFPNTSVFTHISMRIYLGVITNYNIIVNHSICTDIYIFTYFGTFGDDCSRGNAFILSFALFVKSHQLGKSLISIINLNEGSLDGLFGYEITVHQHNAGFGVINIMFILRIREKSDAARLTFFNLSESIDGYIGITHDFPLYE